MDHTMGIRVEKERWRERVLRMQQTGEEVTVDASTKCKRVRPGDITFIHQWLIHRGPGHDNLLDDPKGHLIFQLHWVGPEEKTVSSAADQLYYDWGMSFTECLEVQCEGLLRQMDPTSKLVLRLLVPNSTTAGKLEEGDNGIYKRMHFSYFYYFLLRKGLDTAKYLPLCTKISKRENNGYFLFNI
jgi:hypothetical protein